MGKRGGAALVAAILLGASGCTDGGGGGDSGPPAPTSAAVGPALVDEARNLCVEVTADMTRAIPPGGTEVPEQGRKCTWVQEQAEPTARRFSVQYSIHPTVGGTSAIDLAKEAFFTQTAGMDRGPSMNVSNLPVSGIGDEAAAQHLGGVVVLVVRERNAVFSVTAVGGHSPQTDAVRTSTYPPMEAAAADVARALTAKLDPADPPRPPAPLDYRPGEARVAADPCAGAGPDAVRLLPDLRAEATQPGSDGWRRCAWGKETNARSLAVDVEIAAPSALTGQNAVQVAQRSYRPMTTRFRSGSELMPSAGLGDEAYESYDVDTGYLWVRKGNVMIYVGYRNYSSETPVAREDAKAVARSILAQYP